MPRKPLSICATPGCRELTRDSHCPKHKPEAEARRREQKNKRFKKYDKARGSAHARGYDSRWQKASKAYLRKHPYCVRHLEEQGVHVKADVVDHIIPHKGDKQLFWDKNNWQSLCESCHNRKTRTEDM